MTVEPKERVPLPQSDGESSEKLDGGAGGVLITDPLGDSPMERTTFIVPSKVCACALADDCACGNDVL